MPSQLCAVAEVVASESGDGSGAIWLRRRTVPSKAVVRLTMMVVAAVQTVLVGMLVMSAGFLQDDYLFFDIARQKGFTGNGLTLSVFGSIIPGFTFANTAFSTEHPVVRWHLELAMVLLYALVVFVFYRLLELLFGARPATVVLT